MKKYLIPLLVSTALATACFAKIPEDAVYIGSDTYVFTKSAIKNTKAKTVKVWIGFSDIDPPPEEQRLWLGARSFKARMTFYCSRQESKITDIVLYSQTNFDGRVLRSTRNVNRVDALVPGSNLYDAAEILCE